MKELGDNSGGKELALQTQGLELDPQNSCKNKTKQTGHGGAGLQSQCQGGRDG